MAYAYCDWFGRNPNNFNTNPTVNGKLGMLNDGGDDDDDDDDDEYSNIQACMKDLFALQAVGNEV